MAATMNSSPHTGDNTASGLEFKFLAHVQSLPVVNDSLDQIYSYPIGRNAGETLKSVSAGALKYTGPINPLLQKADSFADSGLKNIESRFPLVKAPTSEIKEKTSGAAKTTVDTYVGAIHERIGGVAGKARENGHAAADYAKTQTDGARSTLHDSIDPLVGPVLDRVEGLLDTYLPKAQAKLDAAKKSAEEDAPDAEEVEQKADHAIKRVYDISTSLYDRGTNAARNTIHFGTDKVTEVATTASDYAKWTLQNPAKVPEAAVSKVQQGTAALQERVNGGIETTRSRAQSLTDLAVQAHSTAVNVYEKEKNAAPKDQPRGLIITSINTALVLTGKTLDHAKTYFQDANVSADLKESASDLGEEASEAGKKAKDAVPGQAEAEQALQNGKSTVQKNAKHASQSVEEILQKQEHN